MNQAHASSDALYPNKEKTMSSTLHDRGTNRLTNVITVLGTMGSNGKTLVSCNLALNLTKLGKTVALIDGDLQFGDVGSVFGCDTPSYSTLDFANAESATSSLVQVLPNPRDGLWVVPGVPEPVQAESISLDLLIDGVTRAAATFDVVIVDCAPMDGFTMSVAEISRLVIILDQGLERNLRILLESMHKVDETYLRHCMVLPNDSGDGLFVDSSPRDMLRAHGVVVPVLPVLPPLNSVESDHPESLLVCELAPDSALGTALRDLAGTVSSRL